MARDLEADGVTPAASPNVVPAPARGLRASARRVVAHGSAIARLERELARSELQRKGATAAAGAGAGIAAGVLMFFAVGFGLAAAAAVLALVVDWWLALLIVFLLLVLLVLVLALVSRNLFASATPLKPEQAIEEARLHEAGHQGQPCRVTAAPEEEIRLEIQTEREQLADALTDLRLGVDSKRRPLARVGGVLVAGLAAMAAVKVVRRFTGE